MNFQYKYQKQIKNQFIIENLIVIIENYKKLLNRYCYMKIKKNN